MPLVQTDGGLMRLALVDIIQPPEFGPFRESWARNAGKGWSVSAIEDAQSV
jgi:hypothetical protein